ncbi:MAG: MFS transporter [Acidimicrobiaceae bacterium]|nr:MFS transporter [Acidimicrobiaceae bacterium]
MADQSPEMNAGEPSVADLAGAILDEEAKRRAEQAERDAETVLPDDLLPGVGDEPMTLREGLRVGGTSMLVMMFVLNMLDELPRAVRVLAPDIQESLDVSDTVLFGILSFGGVTLVLGAVPMAALADRVKRVAIIPVASAFWGVTAFLSGLIVNPFQLFLTNAGTGLGQAYRIPVSNSLLVDTYPIQARSRIFALEGVGRPVGQLLGPLAVGGIAALVGGEDPWRAAFFAVAVAPVVVAVVSAIVLREPPRGRFEKQAVFGDEQVDVEELPVSIGTAFARLRKIKTFYYLTTGVGVLGFALIAFFFILILLMF